MGQRVLDETRYKCPKCGKAVGEWRMGEFAATYQFCQVKCGWHTIRNLEKGV